MAPNPNLELIDLVARWSLCGLAAGANRRMWHLAADVGAQTGRSADAVLAALLADNDAEAIVEAAR